MTDRLATGTVFARRYEVLRCIGMGGMGAVYEVVHIATKRRHALKVLLPSLVADSEARERFAQEACITAEVDSEHVVDVSDAAVDQETGSPYIVMELLKGYSLGQALIEKRKFTLEEVLDIVTQIARALEKTHAAGIVHRDLKPDNIFATTGKDGRLQIKIVDFGIAKVVATASSASRNTVNIGTPLYMAPEQLDGTALDGRADLFSLAHIAFELLTGESYWEPEVRTSPGTLAMIRIMDKGFPEPANVRARRAGVRVGPTFDAWFMRGVARSPHQRYGSAMELVEAFTLAVRLPTMTIDMGLQARQSRKQTDPMPPAVDAYAYAVRPPMHAPAPPPPPSARTGGYPFSDSSSVPPWANPVAQGSAVAMAGQRTTDPIAQNPLTNPKATGGPNVWGMVTPRTKAKRATRAAGAVALLALLSLGALVVYVQVRGSRVSRGKEASSAIEPAPDVGNGSGLPAAEPSTSASATASATATATVSAAASSAPSASSQPSAKPSARPIRTARPPRDPCLDNPRRCR